MECAAAFIITTLVPIEITLKWVESLGVGKGVWSVPTFRFEKLATMRLKKKMMMTKSRFCRFP